MKFFHCFHEVCTRSMKYVTLVNNVFRVTIFAKYSFQKVNYIYGIVSILSKYGIIYKLKNIPYHIYKQSVTKVTIYATESRFTIDYGCKFASLTNNLNIEKGKFVSFFRFQKKGYDDMTKNQEFFKTLSSELKRTKISLTLRR